MLMETLFSKLLVHLNLDSYGVFVLHIIVLFIHLFQSRPHPYSNVT